MVAAGAELLKVPPVRHRVIRWASADDGHGQSGRRVARRAGMELKTGQRGGRAMQRLGGPSSTFFAVRPGACVERADADAAKTYAQLAERPRTGRSLFAELEHSNWRSPKLGREPGRGEFDRHLCNLVRHGRLHVVALGLLSTDAARELRRDLKAALTQAANGRGDTGELLHQVERIAQYVTGNRKATLDAALEAMQTLVELSAGWATGDAGLRGMPWQALYLKVKDVRNDIAHTGTEAVLARTLVMASATVLLDALSGVAGENEVKTVKDVMVTGPVCAHPWQTVADVRRTMLVTDYSELPMANGASGRGWEMVTAEKLAMFLAEDGHGRRLGLRLDEARKERDNRLEVHDATMVGEDKPLHEFRAGTPGRPDLPVVVTRRASDGPVLVGIVTAFDLL